MAKFPKMGSFQANFLEPKLSKDGSKIIDKSTGEPVLVTVQRTVRYNIAYHPREANL